LALNLGIGLFFPNVDMVTHIGGLLFGLGAGFLATLNYRLYWGATLSLLL
jgi:membrane associated rhomboid family serine protease